MSKFNKSTKGSTVTTNLAGGKAYAQAGELALASFLLTSFVSDKYYQSTGSQLTYLKSLLDKVDPVFAAKAAVYARQEFGMRSVSHLAAALLVGHASGSEWGKHFYNRVIRRPDDMLEILALLGEQKPTQAIIKGFRSALGRFDEYQLAKYRGENKTWSLLDLVRLVHPSPTSKNGQALEKLVKGELKQTKTWEAKVSSAKGEEEKSEAWLDMLRSGSLGYLALIRNLNNIAKAGDEAVSLACKQLVNEEAIRKSLVFPFQLVIAFKCGPDNRKIQFALSRAIDLSVGNVPKFEGRSLIAVDTSGSMQGQVSNSEYMRCVEAGALFGAAMFKSNDADLMTFEGDAHYRKLDPAGSVLSIMNSINTEGYQTKFASIFDRAKDTYERIFIFSDMQSWVGDTQRALARYQSKFGVNPHLYCVDLRGYGSSQFPADRVYPIAGFSDKIFDLMGRLEMDRNVLVNTIKEVKLI